MNQLSQSPCRHGGLLKLDSLYNKDTLSIDDEDNLLWPVRRPRLPSETCNSTSHGPSMSSGAFTDQRLCQPEQSSYPEFESRSLCDDFITVSGGHMEHDPQD